MNNKIQTELHKAYKKQLKTLSMENQNDRVQILITYLKYLRDVELFNFDKEAFENIPLLNSTIAELEAAVRQSKSEYVDFHIQNFCELLKINLKEWLTK